MSLLASDMNQGSCCEGSWRDAPDGAFCGECGTPIVPCAAHEECGGVLDKLGRCTSCVNFQVLIDVDGVRNATVGSAISLPLIVQNLSSVRRPLFVTQVWTREPGGDWTPVDLAWERLEAGASAPLPVRAASLDRAGAHRLDVRLAVSTRWRRREENYLFDCGVTINVEAPSATTVNQSITLQAETIGSGATIYNPVRVTGEERSRDRREEAVELPLVRAERAERELGIRGGPEGATVPAQALFRLSGFRAEDRLPDGPCSDPGRSFVFGRSRAKPKGGPNSVRLLVYQSDGALDEELSTRISRRHFEIYVENDRLMLLVESDNGVELNDRKLPRGEAIALSSGDIVHPIIGEPGALAIRVHIEPQPGSLTEVTLSRVPAIKDI